MKIKPQERAQAIRELKSLLQHRIIGDDTVLKRIKQLKREYRL